MHKNKLKETKLHIHEGKLPRNDNLNLNFQRYFVISTQVKICENILPSQETSKNVLSP